MDSLRVVLEGLSGFHRRAQAQSQLSEVIDPYVGRSVGSAVDRSWDEYRMIRSTPDSLRNCGPLLLT